ncbi:MAG: hypothetical protein HYS23_12400 [Geobacter sp.]|nr:hypothetical protein [Geobacter sp.]
MRELAKIVMTSAATILGGVIVLIAGQLLSKFFIEPLQEFKKLLGEIRYSLVFFAREIHTPISGDKDICDKASEALRKHSCDLRSKVAAIPFYEFMSNRSSGFLPNKASVLEAARLLIALSNSVHKDDRSMNFDLKRKIYSLLGFGSIDE